MVLNAQILKLNYLCFFILLNVSFNMAKMSKLKADLTANL